jgi:hypothetical protein
MGNFEYKLAENRIGGHMYDHLIPVNTVVYSNLIIIANENFLHYTISRKNKQNQEKLLLKRAERPSGEDQDQTQKTKKNSDSKNKNRPNWESSP